MLYCTEIVSHNGLDGMRVGVRYKWNRALHDEIRASSDEIFDFASDEIKSAANNPALVGFHHEVISSTTVDFFRYGGFSWKKPSRKSTWLFSWQGREDSNPRPTVLEWLRSVTKPWKYSLFRTFQCTFQAKPRVVIVSENFWCYFDDMIKFQLTY